jgi:hypothetical protein
MARFTLHSTHLAVVLQVAAFTLAATTAACVTEEDCSLNGECVDGACVCIAAWTGARCARLNLGHPTRTSGLHSVDDGRNTSSWGGSVLRDKATGIYHMYAAEMTRHCGINTWTENSRIVHATSNTATGTFTRRDEVFGVFSHEPNAVRGPDGEWVLFFTAHIPWNSTPAPHSPACTCVDGSTPHTGCADPTGNEGATYASWSTSPNGPWSEPYLIIDTGGRQSDTNLSPVLLPNGSLVGVWRTWDSGSSSACGFGGSCPHLVTASNWKDNTTYVFHKEPLFAASQGLRAHGTEDPALYLDAKGRFHALFHNMQSPSPPPMKRPRVRPTRVGVGAPNISGGHAFSTDGVHWNYTGVAFNASGTYDDGSTFAFLRRERPHPVFAADGHTLVAVTNGVTYADSTTASNDACFTFLQPVVTTMGGDAPPTRVVANSTDERD